MVTEDDTGAGIERGPGGDAPETPTRTRVGRKWLRKMLIVWVIFVGAGAFFAWDGFLRYPERGREFTRFALRDYLAAAETARAVTSASVSVPDPAEELRRLKGAAPQTQSPLEVARRTWLEALSRVASLESIAQSNAAGPPPPATLGDPPAWNRTVFPDPVKARTEIVQYIGSSNPPAPLNEYDIPLQHVIWVIAAIAGGWLSLNVARAFAATYTYDPAERRLTLPNGRSFTPDDVEDVDLRKHNQYIWFLRVAGFDGELRFDVLKHDHLEGWLETIQKHWPGYEPEAPDEAPAEPPSEGAAAAPDA